MSHETAPNVQNDIHPAGLQSCAGFWRRLATRLWPFTDAAAAVRRAAFEPLEPRVLLSAPADVAATLPHFLPGASALFIENGGQWDDQVHFLHQGDGASVAVTDSGIRFQVYSPAMTDGASTDGAPADAPALLEFGLSFLGSDNVTPNGFDPSETAYHYVTDGGAMTATGYSGVIYDSLYDGVNLHAWGRGSNLKYEFHLDPGSDANQIQIRYDGIAGLSVAKDGSLIVDLGDAWAPLVDDAPYVYQEIDGERIEIQSRFILIDSHTYGFEILGDYDASRELIVDPELDWSGYSGGTDYDMANDVAVDAEGNVYVAGMTWSTGWVSGGYDTLNNGSSDGFVAKYSASGQQLWSTYLGVSDPDFATALVVADDGSVYVTGDTRSSGWGSGGYDNAYNGGTDAFVLKLNGDTGARVWSTYVGGTGTDKGTGIDVDVDGNVYVTGHTASSTSWVSGGPDITHNGGTDAFLVKISATGEHVWSTYLGATGDDIANGVAIASDGSIYLTGETRSAGWLSGSWDDSHNGATDAFLLKLDSTGGHLWSTYLGHDGNDVANGIALDVEDNVYITGYTHSSSWVSGGFNDTFAGERDAFAAKFTAAGIHEWSTFLGGSSFDLGDAIDVAADGTVYVAGDTSSSAWTVGGFDTNLNGSDGFIVALSGAGEHLWSSYIGGTASDSAKGVAAAAGGIIYVIGSTNSSGWTTGGHDTSHGGSADGFVARIIANVPPVPAAGSESEVTIAENQTAVTTVTAIDPDSPNLQYTISGGHDGHLFTIDPATGALAFSVAPNYEDPTDHDRDNVYHVEIRISDGTSHATHALTVNITDVNDAPTFTSSDTVSLAEGATIVVAVTAADDDPDDTLTLALTGGADAGRFSFNSESGVLTFLAAPDFESPGDADQDNDYLLEFEVSDGTHTVTQFLTVTVTDVNEAPAITSGSEFSADENTTLVTTIAASDPDAGAMLTYTISGGADAALFDIHSATGVLTFRSGPDFESRGDADGDNIYDVQVRVTDGVLSDTADLAITVTDVNEAPVMTTGSAVTTPENTTTVTTIQAEDPDFGDVLTYTITGGDDAARFTVDNATGVLSFVTVPDYESPVDVDGDNVYEVTVLVSDGAYSASRNFAVTVVNINEAPAITSGDTATVAENTTTVGTVIGTDPDAGAVLTYSISGGADAARFVINRTTGVLSFLAAPDFESPADADGDNVYDVQIEVSDGALSASRDLGVTVTDVNEAPAITSNAAASVAENTKAVIIVTATDPDAGDTLIYSIAGGADAALFTIDQGTGALSFIAAPNFESPTDIGGDNVYDVRVQVSDGALTATRDVAVTVTDVNEAPAITSPATADVAENTTAVTIVTATDPDAGAVLTYSITGGADAARFVINRTTGVLSFLAAPDFESPADADGDNVYDVQIEVSDGALSGSRDLNVTVTDVNEAPAITSNAAASVAENTKAVIIVTAADPDAGDTLIYSIAGGADAALFTIDQGTGALSFIAAPNFESPTDIGGDNVYDVRVQVSDGALTATRDVAVTVTDVNEAPAITSQATADVAENTTAVTIVTATDPDAGAVLTYSISGGADAGLFIIDSLTGAVRFLHAPNHEAPTDVDGDGVYDVRIRVSDGAHIVTQELAITVTDVNEAPAITSASAYLVPENQTAVATITAVDPDAGDTLAYAISGGTDGALFTIDSATGALRFLEAPDFESPADSGAENIYVVQVQVSDGDLVITRVLTVTVDDVNEAPAFTSEDNWTVYETETAITTITAADPDTDAVLTYSIVGGADAALFSIDSATGALTFLAPPDYENPADASRDNIYHVQIQVSDGLHDVQQDVRVTVTDLVELTFYAGSTATYSDALGHQVILGLAGPGLGIAYFLPGGGFEGGSANPLRIELHGTTAGTTFAAVLPTPEAATRVEDMRVYGDLHILRAPGVDLAGSLTITGHTAGIVLGRVADSTITLGGSAHQHTSLRLERLTDTTLTATSGIGNMTISGAWADTDSITDRIVAPWLWRLTVGEVMQASLDLSGLVAPNGYSLGAVSADRIAGGTYTLATGSVGRIVARGLQGIDDLTVHAAEGNVVRLAAHGSVSQLDLLTGGMHAFAIRGALSQSQVLLTGAAPMAKFIVTGRMEHSRLVASGGVTRLETGGSEQAIIHSLGTIEHFASHGTADGLELRAAALGTLAVAGDIASGDLEITGSGTAIGSFRVGGSLRESLVMATSGAVIELRLASMTDSRFFVGVSSSGLDSADRLPAASDASFTPSRPSLIKAVILGRSGMALERSQIAAAHIGAMRIAGSITGDPGTSVAGVTADRIDAYAHASPLMQTILKGVNLTTQADADDVTVALEAGAAVRIVD